MEERRVTEFDVAVVLAEPDEVEFGDDGEIITRKLLGRRVVQVVYDEDGALRRVITVMAA